MKSLFLIMLTLIMLTKMEKVQKVLYVANCIFWIWLHKFFAALSHTFDF